MVGIGVDPICAARSGFNHPIASVMNRISVIAGATDQRVGIRRIADEPIGKCVAGQEPPCAAHGVDELDRGIGKKGVVGIGVDHVGPSARRLNHPVARVMNRKGIIPCTTCQRVGMGGGGHHPVGQGIAGQGNATAASGHGHNLNRLACAQRIIHRGDDAIQPISGRFQHHIQRVEHEIGVVSRAADHQVAAIHGLKASRRDAHRPHRRQSWQGGQVVHQGPTAIAAPVCQKAACRGRVGEGGPCHVPNLLGRTDLIEQPDIPHRGVIRERHIALAQKVAGARHKLPFGHPRPIQPNGQLPANILIAEGQAVQIPVEQGRGQDAVQKAINRGPFKL